MRKVFCHNLYWCQGHPFKSDQPGDPVPDVVDGLAAMYAAAEADVICLQEVHRPELAAAFASRLGMHVAHCPVGAHPQYGGAVLWRGDGRIVADSRGRCIERVWQILDVAGITIANVHLPSNRQLGNDGGPAARLADLQGLFAAHDTPLDVVCGDFNEKFPDSPVSRHFDSLGYRDAAIHSGLADRTSHVNGGRGDWLRVFSSLVPRLHAYGVATADDLRLTDGRHLSDHLPIWLTLADSDATR
jgi:endonuclease/exonuclease/phosphatase family metal-dependent hydrolase